MHDVIILGSGFSGTILGAILARHGHDVLLIDAGKHPRFAIGESTIPQTSQVLSLLAREYKVPELDKIGLDSPFGAREVAGPTSGIKKIFGFVYHGLGEEHKPEEAQQFAMENPDLVQDARFNVQWEFSDDVADWVMHSWLDLDKYL